LYCGWHLSLVLTYWGEKLYMCYSCFQTRTNFVAFAVIASIYTVDRSIASSLASVLPSRSFIYPL
jgi:hypothetical protein